jgi:hypothetical protein
MKWLDCLSYLVRSYGPLSDQARLWCEQKFYDGWQPLNLLHALNRGYWKNPDYWRK